MPAGLPFAPEEARLFGGEVGRAGDLFWGCCSGGGSARRPPPVDPPKMAGRHNVRLPFRFSRRALMKTAKRKPSCPKPEAAGSSADSCPVAALMRQAERLILVHERHEEKAIGGALAASGLVRPSRPLSLTTPPNTQKPAVNKHIASQVLPRLPSFSLLLAGEEGLEPPTPGFGDRCSNQLSYTPVQVVSRA
jgi:hypothetical protein